MKEQQILHALQDICCELQLPYHWELRSTSRPVDGYAIRLIDTGEAFLGSRKEFMKITDATQLRAYLHRRLSHPWYPTITLGLHSIVRSLTSAQIRELQVGLATLLRWWADQVCCYLVGTGRVVEVLGPEAQRSPQIPGEPIELDYHLIHDLATEGVAGQLNRVLIAPDHLSGTRCWVGCQTFCWREAVFVPSLPDLVHPASEGEVTEK